MSRSTTHRSGDEAWNGEGRYTVMGRIVASAATVQFGHFVAPCDGRIVHASANTIVAPTHATSDLSFGTQADIDSHINEIDWQNHALGAVDIVPGAAEGTEPILDLDIVKGQAYAWAFAGGDATGEIWTCLVIEPA